MTITADTSANTVMAAAWKLLGTARDMPGDVAALAAALHAQECDQRHCETGPDDDTVIRASGLVQAGWRRTGHAAVNLANLLGQIAHSWEATNRHNAPADEINRWLPVCALASQIAKEIER